MSVQPNCFEGLIGLARESCPCLGDMPEDAAASQSGLFLAELDGLNLRQVKNATAEQCQEFWDMMTRARDNAETQADADLLAELRKVSSDRKKPIRSVIGEDSDSRRILTMDKSWHGMTVQFAHMVGGIATLRRIGGKFNFTGDLTIYVFDRYSDTWVAGYTIPVVAGQTTWTEIEPLELDMDASGYANTRYWFIYQPGANAAYNTRIHCGCGGSTWRPNWNSHSPYYESNVQRQGYGWSWWAMASGVKGNDIADREDWSTTNETQGLLLDFQFTCNAFTTLCNDGYDPQDPIQLTRAYARLYLAGYKLLTQVKMSSNPTFWTTLNGEGVEALRKQYFEEYRNRIGWYDDKEKVANGYLLTTLMEPENINRYGDCLICKDQHGMQVSRIRP